MNLTRSQMVALVRIFDQAGVKPLAAYYAAKENTYRRAAGQVTRLRAIFALLAGASAAAVGFFPPPAGEQPNIPIKILLIVAIVAPALASAFQTISDLYGWDRRRNIAVSAKDNLGIADAESPVDRQADGQYRVSLARFVETTLTVMSDEASMGKGRKSCRRRSRNSSPGRRRLNRRSNRSNPTYFHFAKQKPPRRRGGFFSSLCSQDAIYRVPTIIPDVSY